ncbi:ATP-binding protein [Chitinibacter bivalviorum]|uniref:ATP-binding protein n=1 Tax=Chitinibacter bivalviorum TaxID=2739434 RepID=A0A7H9BJV7_9NEIS|nr:ATP-binding protein [Chitinibacter bivalviorum]QLG88940.1 ATP-binding protein [Chitinibacter bivalviorum]
MSVTSLEAKRIAIVGPESCGKTQLAQELSRELHAPWVPEFARPWFAAQQRTHYDLDDIIAIARGQLALEAQLALGTQWLLCDTSVLVCIIWAEVRFGFCPEELASLWHPQDYALHLLLEPDLPWEADPLRENPIDRDVLFQRYESALQAKNTVFVRIAGHGKARLSCARAALASIL